MIYTSTELFNAFAEDTRQIMVRVKINGAVFDNDNISTLNLEYGSMDGANFSLGSTFASSLKITFAELVEGLAELDEIEVEMGAVLPDETIEYVKMGTFIINEEVMMDRNNNTTSIEALDRMVMLGNIYESTLPGETARIIDIAVDIANQAGVVVSSDFDRLRTDSIRIPQEHTLRDAIGLIAQFEVGFATFNRDGELAIRKLNDSEFNITPEDYTMKGLVKNEVPFRLNGVQCQVGDSEEDVLQTGASTGTQIILNNPSMTQEHLDRIYTELSALNYYPFSLDWYGHPALEAGDWIEIEDLQGNKFKTPNLHYTLDFNGGLKAKSQAETTSSSEVVYQYKSPLKQEIQAIAARLSASGGNHVYDDLTEPENPKEGDLWFKPEGPDTLILKYTRLEDGTLDWVEELNTGDTTKNADAIAEQQQEIEEARQVADEAWNELEQAKINAGFESLDDTLQNMNYITTIADQNAQQAITNASNAYGLAQTSISEAQTAQANSLTALGKADNALDGVSSLNVRVDDVEAELELKADNAFMNEDGTLTTLSNAITFNAHRFSSDMSRIESRVESLARAINLVILRDAFENMTLRGGEVYPNATVSAGSDTMRELIDVVAGEELALTKNTVDGDNIWRIIFYDSSNSQITRYTSTANQVNRTVPAGATKMWVSYPKGSKPQITKGSEFVPYRPNIADQMTTDEMVIFRNEYDEFADKTERRLTSIDSSGGRLATAELLITQTANGLALKADQTTVNELTDEVESLGTEFDIVAGQVSSKVWVSDIDDIEIGGRNLIKESDPIYAWTGEHNVHTNSGAFVYLTAPHYPAMYQIEVRAIDDSIVGAELGWQWFGSLQGKSVVLSKEWEKASAFLDEPLTIGLRAIGGLGRIELRHIKAEKGNKATDWTPAPEDTDAKIDHIETEWTQTFDTFSQTVSGIDGRVTDQKQTIDSISSTVSGHGSRISTVEQTASGLQSTIADKANQSQVTQLADGLNLLVREQTENLIPKESNLTESWSGWILGSNITFNRIVNNRTELYVGTAEQRIYYPLTLEQGKKYKITFEARAHVGGRELSVGRGTKNLQRIAVHSLPRTYEAIFESDSSSHFSIYFHSNGTYEIGNVQVVETTAVSSAQISVLEDNINLRVTKGDVLSQINIEAERTLIQSDKLLLNATNTVITGTAWMDGAVIANASIDGAKIQDATIGSAKIADLDVGKISGDTAEFVQAGFNSISSTTSIDANGISILRTDGTRSARLGVNGYEFWLDGVAHGSMGTRKYMGTDPLYLNKNSISLYARRDSYLSLGYQGDKADNNDGYVALSILGDTGDVNINNYLTFDAAGSIWGTRNGGYLSLGAQKQLWLIANDTTLMQLSSEGTSKLIDVYGTMDMNGRNTLNSNAIQFGTGDQVYGSIFPVSANKELQIRGEDLLRLVVGGDTKMIMRASGTTDMYAPINMNGNNISGLNRLSLIDSTTHLMSLTTGGLLVDGARITIATGNPSSIDTIARFDGQINFFKNVHLNGNTIFEGSDERIKENIVDRTADDLATIMALEYKDYDIINGNKNQRGFIAQQLKTIDSDLVTENEGQLGFNSSGYMHTIGHAVQQLAHKHDAVATTVDSHTDTIHQLQLELSKANRRIEELEGAM